MYNVDGQVFPGGTEPHPASRASHDGKATRFPDRSQASKRERQSVSYETPQIEDVNKILNKTFLLRVTDSNRITEVYAQDRRDVQILFHHLYIYIVSVRIKTLLY